MIILNLIICLLLYTMDVHSHPLKQEDNITLPSINFTSPISINGLSDSVSDTYSDIGIDTLITKITQISNRYRKDVNGTIADVQQLVLNDQGVPRLTRGEIIELLENFTKTDPEDLKEKISKGRQQYQKAIMLVMPYTSKNTDNFNIEELFTKPPVTHIIGTETSKPVDVKKQQNTNQHIEILALEPSTYKPPVMKRPMKPHKFIKSSENRQEIRNSTNFEQKPKKEIIIKQVSIKQESPVFITSTTRKPYIQKTTRFPNHRYPDESEIIPANNGLKVIAAPNLLRPKPSLELLKTEESQKDQIRDMLDEPIRIYSKPEIITEKEFRPTVEPKPHRHIYKATVSSTIRPRTRSTKSPIRTTEAPSLSTESALANIGVPDDMKDFVKDVNFGDIKPIKFHSQYDGSVMNFPKQEMVTENLRDILDSIGGLQTQKPTTTTTTMIPGISIVADNLSPDMRELLMNFGLLEDPDKPKEEFHANPPNYPAEETAISNPYSYTQFKPLPDSAPSRKDMEEFLANFGLTGNSQRSGKKMKKDQPLTTEEPKILSEVPDINMEMIPESMHSILEDIGLSEKKPKTLSIDQDTKETHVFNPELTNVSENEIQRLSQLLDTIKRLEKLNRTATPEDLQDLDLENIRELTKILKQEQSASVPLDQQKFGPDPLDFDISIEKNEVKRQESTSTTTSTTTTTEGSPSLLALEESFGGNAGKGTETVDESLPPPRKNGFYYLVDWNTFLEVGEDDKKTTIRFSPRAGDPSRFLRINVP